MLPSGLVGNPEYSLDDLYLMVAAIYGEQNAQRSPSATFAHFVEVCGMLAIHDRKKKREDLEVEDALCKSLGWFFPLLAKLRVSSLENLIYRKFPYCCPYCRECPHQDPICKTIRGTTRTVDHAAVQAKYVQNADRRPRSLNEWQEMFSRIYPRELSTLGTCRSMLGLLEELGELSEAVRVFEKYPKYFAGEAADVFSYIMGIANEHKLRLQVEEKPDFNFESEFLRRYPGICVQCGHHVCICPSVPEATVGRLAKELDLEPVDQLFNLDALVADQRGRETGASVLQGLGGLPAIAGRFPLDRGEANRAMVLLCLRLSEEVRSKDSGLAKKLYQAAIDIAIDTRAAGSRSHSETPLAVVDLLTTVWPVLSLAVMPEDATLSTQIAKLLQVEAVRIGVVTALPKEFAAMRVMLDEERPVSVAGDPSDYVVGTLRAADGKGAHLIVVTLLKEMGNNGAAAAVTHLLRSFPKVRDVLMVGIAGGIPSPNDTSKHIRLGDIVVSDKEGVVQYDNLKIGIGKVKLRSSSSKPSSRMIGVVNRLESERIMQQYPWEVGIDAASKLDGAARPPDGTDRLYKWSGECATEIDHPVDPARRSGKPKVHYGRIGASNSLLKNPALRDQVRDDCGVIAVEMEGSGIADAAWTAGQHYLLIRGISDYCDEKKNDLWQGYAAVAAAAYASALISHVPLESLSGESNHSAGEVLLERASRTK